MCRCAAAQGGAAIRTSWVVGAGGWGDGKIRATRVEHQRACARCSGLTDAPSDRLLDECRCLEVCATASSLASAIHRAGMVANCSSLRGPQAWLATTRCCIVGARRGVDPDEGCTRGDRHDSWISWLGVAAVPRLESGNFATFHRCRHRGAETIQRRIGTSRVARSFAGLQWAGTSGERWSEICIQLAEVGAMYSLGGGGEGRCRQSGFGGRAVLGPRRAQIPCRPDAGRVEQFARAAQCDPQCNYTSTL